MENSLVIILYFSCIASSVSSFPLHASCDIDWNFSLDCGSIQSSLVNIIKQWSSADNCKNGGEKCLYQLKSKTDTEIKAVHETPVKHYKDDLTFTFVKKSDGGCAVKGNSRSETWYAVLDFGTNYCNLHNLITGAGLDKTAGYKETTSDSVCTQFSKANCDKY